MTAHFADGSAEGDLLVGADGLRSTIRQQCLPDLAPLYAGYVAWRALIAEAAFPPAIHRELFDYMTFCLPPGEQFLGYPVAGPDNDLRPVTAATTWSGTVRPTRRPSCSMPAHRRKRHHPRDLDPAAADPARGDRRICARRPSGCWRRSSARSCA